MKKATISGISMIALGVLFLVASCKKNVEILNADNGVKKENTVNKSFVQVENEITLADAQTIGANHNTYMLQGLQGMPTSNSGMQENFDNINIEGVSQEYKDEIFNYINSSSLNDIENDIIQALVSTESISIFNSVKSIVLDGNNFSTKSSLLESQLGLVTDEFSGLSGFEKEILLTFIETSRSSLSFWMPTTLGGQGIGIGIGYDDITPAAIDWGAIGYADGAGAVGVLIRTIYLAGGGPIGWTAILGAIGWGAAYGSGTALLWQLL